MSLEQAVAYALADFTNIRAQLIPYAIAELHKLRKSAGHKIANDILSSGIDDKALPV